jgi:hypothetical protein
VVCALVRGFIAPYSARNESITAVAASNRIILFEEHICTACYLNKVSFVDLLIR